MFSIFQQFDHCHKVSLVIRFNGGDEMNYYLCENARTSGGRLHLLPDVGKILLADATLIEDPSSDSEKDDEGELLVL